IRKVKAQCCWLAVRVRESHSRPQGPIDCREDAAVANRCRSSHSGFTHKHTALPQAEDRESGWRRCAAVCDDSGISVCGVNGCARSDPRQNTEIRKRKPTFAFKDKCNPNAIHSAACDIDLSAWSRDDVSHDTAA